MTRNEGCLTSGLSGVCKLAGFRGRSAMTWYLGNTLTLYSCRCYYLPRVFKLPLSCFQGRGAMQRKFRLALVGAGLITESAHLPAALASDAVSVAAIVDPVTE